MCIIFLYQNNDSEGQYRLILAANRDEYKNRLAKPADFHPQHPDVLCGLDMEQGVQGGTWLGVTRTGKFSALTNVLCPTQDMTKSPRGRLVIDYLTGGSAPTDYMQSLREQDHRRYNLITGILDPKGKVQVAYYSNCDGKDPRLLVDDFIVVACTSLGGDWHKMKHGKKLFKGIVQSSKSNNGDGLTNALFETLLTDTTNLYPDNGVIEQAGGAFPEEFIKKYCSIRVTGIPTYATRMQTVILVDKSGNVSFTERTLVHEDGENVWSKRAHSFKIGGDN